MMIIKVVNNDHMVSMIINIYMVIMVNDCDINDDHIDIDMVDVMVNG